MRIREIQIRPFSFELAAPLKTARGEYHRRDCFELRASDEAHCGFGEAAPLPAFGMESPGLCRSALERLCALGSFDVPEEPAEIDRFLSDEKWLNSAPAARHAMESALLDLLARRRGVPLRSLLNPQARTAVQVSALIHGETPRAVAEEAAVACARGFRTIKLKVAFGSVDADLDRLRAARDAVGAEVRIRIDANGAWRPPEAIRNLDRLAIVGLELCEQPVSAFSLRRFAWLREKAPCAIAADESLMYLMFGTSTEGLLRPTPTVDLFVIKPMVLGGVWRALELAREGHSAGVGSYVTSSLDGAVAHATAAHLAAALPTSDWASGLSGGAVDDGWIPLGEEPGIGIDGVST